MPLRIWRTRRVFGASLLSSLGRAHASAPSSAFSPSTQFLVLIFGAQQLERLERRLDDVVRFAVPSDLVRMFWIPADSRIARTGPPAMTPVPSEAGLSRTCPAP
jgi:hypothetical protein